VAGLVPPRAGIKQKESGLDPQAMIFWALAVLAAFLVGLSKGGLPVIGMLAVPLMALAMDPLMAAGLLLPVYVASDMVGLYAYRREYSARNLLILIPATALGVLLGWLMVGQVPKWVVTAIIGLIGAVFALYLLTRRGPAGEPKPANWGPGLFWGAITGYTSFIAHAGAPPYQVYVLPQRLPKLAFAGTSTILFAWVNAIKLPPYIQLGQINLSSLKDAAILALPAIIGVLIGVRVVKVLPEKLFFQLVTWALLLISLKLLWDAVGQATP
jgi:uncharacterized protein